jgi:uracil-DNA glycosylase
VCGTGPSEAKIVFVGEQPGDQEDIAGTPFVGPAGQILDEALLLAGIDRKVVYLTNAVKHFKFSPRGKRRIHERPNQSEIQMCKWWLDKELDLIKPNLIVALGSTAAFALTGNGKDITGRRGKMVQLVNDRTVFVTYHPSAILRNRDAADTMRKEFFADIAKIGVLG